MDPHYANVVKSYKAHESTISLRERLDWGVPGVPDPELGLDDKLTQPSFATGADTPETPQQCPNCQAREDGWLAPPHSYREGYNFFSLLGHLCVAAKIRECRRKKCLEIKAAMQAVAPPCEWQEFRGWALVAMSCQQAFTMKERLSAAHTHLVNVVFSCHELVGCLDQFPRRTVAVRAGPNTMTAIGVCNLVCWMLSIQQRMGLISSSGSGTRPGFPDFLSGVATQRALREADSMAICRNRLWNMLDVSERKQFELPQVLDALRPRPWIRHPDHQLCTQTRCQGAHLDSSKVDQLHKNPEGRHGQCSEGSGCAQLVFPVDLVLPPAVEKGERTAWSLEASPRLLRPGESYLAISHVWSDGTGVGRKAPGSVNGCLLGYFSAIARALECDGIWWDALSIPTEPSARTKALGTMHTNYQDAKCTVVHDLFLLDLEWTDPESACLALALSPWFTRGWTALELAMSHTVKVLFKGRDGDGAAPDIRDLEADILAHTPSTSSRAHWLASQVIRRLREPARSLDSLLAILRPRSTSWMRDRTVIATLLAGVPSPDLTLAEAEVMQRLLKHLGFVSYAALLHGRPTMTSSGPFSWCPATLDDMPVDVGHRTKQDLSWDGMPAVGDDGSVVAKWEARPVSATDVRKRRIQPHGSDISAVAKVEAALVDWPSCLLLYHAPDSSGPALLVTAIGVDDAAGREVVIDCRYVGAVRDSRPPGDRGVINISKFEPDKRFGRAADPDDSDDFDEYAVSYPDGGSVRDLYMERLRSGRRTDPSDDDGDGGKDYNSFYPFKIRLGRDGGKEGARAWDIVKSAWKAVQARRESSRRTEGKRRHRKA